VITLYGAPKTRAFRVLWALEELEIPYELVPISPAEAKRPDLRKLNPNGKVPTLVDGKIVLWESLAINFYLCETYGADLWPSSVEGRGQALKWSFWAMSQIEGPVDAVARHGAVLAPGWLDVSLTALDEQLQSVPYLLGETFSIADLNVATMFFRPVVMRVDLQPFPAVRAWLTRCTTRAAFQRMERRGREPLPESEAS
jgi:glutathione S-transferase